MAKKAARSNPRKFLGQFELKSMEVIGKGDGQLLHIELQHSQTLIIYDVDIDISFVFENQFLMPFFKKDLKKLKSALEEALEQELLQADHNGNLLYYLKFREETHEITLPAKKRQMNQMEILIKKTQKNLVAYIDKKMNEMQQKLTSLIQQKLEKFTHQQAHTINTDTHAHAFTIQKDQQDSMILITKTSGTADQFYSFIKQEKIPANSLTSFKILQIKTQDSNIYTGIATDAIFGVTNAHQKGQVILYDSSSGKVNGKKVGSVYDGSYIQVYVNTEVWEIIYNVDEEPVTRQAIPARMRNKDLYFVVMMCDNDDQIGVIKV